MSDTEFTGRWFKTLYGPSGEVKTHIVGTNVVCTVGKNFLASFLASAAAAASTFTMKYIAIGTSATPETAADTQLGAEVSRTTGTASSATQIYQVTATFATGSGTGAITEYGLFSSSTGGTIFCHDTEAVINKGANDTLAVVCQITIS